MSLLQGSMLAITESQPKTAFDPRKDCISDRRKARQNELRELVRTLSNRFGPHDISVLCGVTDRHVYRVLKELGIECRPIPPEALLERLDPAIAKRCMILRGYVTEPGYVTDVGLD